MGKREKMDQIVGYENEKKELLQLRRMLHEAERYRENGLRIPRGLILCGAPGIGKTVLARSIADSGIYLEEVQASLNRGRKAQESFEEAFRIAKMNAPSILLLDELDKCFGDGTDFLTGGRESLKKALIHEMEGVDEFSPVLVVATCNALEPIGGALLRSGRFDRILKMDPPDAETRLKIFQYYLDKVKLPKNLDEEQIAKITQGYTGAQIECLVNECGIRAMEREDHTITIEDVREVMNKIAFSGSVKEPLKDIDERRKIAVHEAGHAVVSRVLEPESFHMATILPQGDSEGHVTFVGEEARMPSVRYLEHRVTIALGGRVAERVIYGENFLGSSADLINATKMMYQLLTLHAAYGYEYVMNAATTQTGGFLISDEGKEATRLKVSEKLSEMDCVAERILAEHRPLFDALVELLMERQTVNRDELLDLEKKLEKAS